MKHDFSWFFKKKSLPMRQKWFDAEKIFQQEEPKRFEIGSTDNERSVQ